MLQEESDLQEVRSNSIIEYSLSELAFILFFILLLFITFKTIEFQRETEKQEEEKAELQGKLDDMTDEVKQIVDQIQTIKDRFPEEIPDEDLDEMFEELVAAKGLIERNGELTEALIEAEDQINGLVAEKGATSDQIRGYIAALNKKNGEASFCWYDPEGKSEPIFDVVVNDRGYSVYGHWPESRNSEVRNTPEVNRVIGNLQTREDFLSNALALFNISVAKECRYLVRYFDEITSSDGDGIRIASRDIQERFYIVIVSGDEVYETWIKNQ